LTLRSSNTIPYNADNQRTGAPQGQPAETYVYDGSGNPTVYRNVNLTYDSGNHLTSYGTTTPILSLYGAEGLRRKKTVGSTSTWYVYDGADPVFELNANGTVKATNVFGANGLVSRRVNGSTSFYAVDPLGHAANLVNSAGSVLYNCGYDAYGQPYGNATMLTYGYGAQHGYYRDSEAAYADNLLLCTNRWYDPSTARWLTRDPIGSAGGPNLYGYVGGDPMGGADPSGLRPLTSQDGIRFGILRSMPSKDTKERPIPGLVEGAIAALKAEIDAVPAGCDDPARLRALWYAIDNSASNTWDAWGSPFGYANATTGQRIPYTRNKCNVFIADCYGYGAGVGFGGSGVPTLPYRGAHRVYSANEWASTRNPIPHYAASRCPRAGDIVAFSGDSHGHMTIKVGPGVLIYTDGTQIMLGSFDRVLADNSGWMGRRYYQ
jgi:RHS repeat-associated protein